MMCRNLFGRLSFVCSCVLLFSLRPTEAQEVELQDCVVQFAREVRVPALASGRITRVFVKLNDVLAAKDPIARMDDRSLLIQRNAAVLRLNVAKGEVADDLKLQYAETSLAEAQAELEANQGIQKDVSGAVPRIRLKKLRLAVERGNLEVAQAKKSIKQSHIEVQLREADLSVLDDQLRNLHVESPLDGVVVELNHNEGEWIERGDSLATVAQINRLHVHALVSSSEIAPRSCKGQAVTVHWIDPTTGQALSLRGEVLSVDPELLSGGYYRLRALILNKVEPKSGQWMLTPGMEVNMKMQRRIASIQSSNSNR